MTSIKGSFTFMWKKINRTKDHLNLVFAQIQSSGSSPWYSLSDQVLCGQSINWTGLAKPAVRLHRISRICWESLWILSIPRVELFIVSISHTIHHICKHSCAAERQSFVQISGIIPKKTYGEKAKSSHSFVSELYWYC